MKMYDMAEKRGNDSPTESKEPYYPSTSLSSKQIPDLKGKKFGDKVSLHIMGEVVGIREDCENKEDVSYNIKIMKCGLMNKVSKDDYKKMSEEDKDKTDEKEVMGEE